MLVLSVIVDGDDVHECISLGASGYIAKDADRSEICDAIRSVAAGQTVLSTDAVAGIATELQHRHAVRAGLLTDREGEVLGLLATGASAPDIAAQLHLSAATVKTHLHNLYAKLGVSDRAAAVAEGMRRGLDQLAPPPPVGGGKFIRQIDQSADGGPGRREPPCATDPHIVAFGLASHGGHRGSRTGGGADASSTSASAAIAGLDREGARSGPASRRRSQPSTSCTAPSSCWALNGLCTSDSPAASSP